MAAALMLATLFPAALRADEAKMLVRVDISTPDRAQALAHLPIGMDAASVKPGEYVDIVILPSKLWALDAAGLSYTTLMKGPWDVTPYGGKAA
ncbi:MAG TPA: hypothetical protein VMF29_06535, partial [Candidatus Edwardsbacteria bacterium]|nr:hypothetical protein [Candidatus Edwardsbacteria bacterium]